MKNGWKQGWSNVVLIRANRVLKKQGFRNGAIQVLPLLVYLLFSFAEPCALQIALPSQVGLVESSEHESDGEAEVSDDAPLVDEHVLQRWSKQDHKQG